MKIKRYDFRFVGKVVFGVILPVLFLSLFSKPEFTDLVYRTFFVISILFLSRVFTSKPADETGDEGSVLLLLVSVLFLGLTYFFETTIFAWLFLTVFFTLLILISESLSSQPVWVKWVGRSLLTLFAGIFPVVINQIMIRFSEEEFYTAIYVLFFSIFWFFLWGSYSALLRKIPHNIKWFHIPLNSISPKISLLMVLFSLVIILVVGFQAYQNSFYPETVISPFPGISSNHPILCESSITDDQSEIIEGTIVQNRYAQAIASKDQLTTIDYGFLAVYYQSDTYFSLFKENLLIDAQNGLYTTLPGSVKWGQWEAAQVLYYYLKVIEIKPDLFDKQESLVLRDWITAINNRAQQVGWVDWMYAIAFSHKPTGAYLNQDIGAGLYSILNQIQGLDEELKSRNANFLEQYERGWTNRFRVTDDAISYQPVWITNSYFQSLLSGEINQADQRLSFEWIEAQALPNGDLLTYNFPEKISVAPIALFGSILTEDSSLLWLANTSMNTLDKTVNLPVQVGAEQKISGELKANIPDIGTCLIYGNSGLPEQNGPLAPDKIVFRNGWQEDDLFILLNLRFTGWHRYKATNSISLIYSGIPLVEEQHEQESIPWLPIGRALVRDKRIPIEQLNTLLIPRTGLDAVLNSLFNVFGPYSQDPPFYADILDFYTSDSYDYSATHIENWHGWDFSRSIHFFQDGPVVIVDEGTNEKSRSAQIRWHLNSSFQVVNNNRFQMKNGNVDILLIGQEQGKTLSVRNENELSIEYESPSTGHLKLITLLLPDSVKDAEFISYSENILSLKLGENITRYELIP